VITPHHPHLTARPSSFGRVGLGQTPRMASVQAMSIAEHGVSRGYADVVTRWLASTLAVHGIADELYNRLS
jgi:hypothetical protein